MKNNLLIIIAFVLAMPSLAQTDKKSYKNIEKQAIALPSGSLVVEGAYSYTIKSADSSYGRLSSAESAGTGSFQALVEDGKQDAKMKFPVVGLHCSQTEVTNADYNAFVGAMKKKDSVNYIKYLPDTALWGMKAFAPFVKYYHVHEAYDDYPAVNISHKNAQAYCDWLTETYNSYPGRKHKKVRFRLPTEIEWIYSYLGGGSDFSIHNHGNLRNSKGQMLANFRRVKQTQIRSAADSVKFKVMFPKLNDEDFEQGIFITTPVVSYWPNDYDIYNMMGNISEFVSEYGITKGGGWNSTGFYLMPLSRETYLSEATSAAPHRGFRWVMEIVEE